MTIYEKLKTVDIEEMALLFMAFAAKCIRDTVGEKIEDSFIADESNYIEVKKWLRMEFDEGNEFKYKGRLVDGVQLTSYGHDFCLTRKDLCDACLKSLDKRFMDGESEVQKND